MPATDRPSERPSNRQQKSALTVGATQLSQAAADGYNLGFLPVGTTTTRPRLKKTSYNADS